MSDKLHLSIQELAARWDIPPIRLSYWRIKKRGPKYIKIGRKILYPRADVEAFEQAQAHAPGE